MCLPTSCAICMPIQNTRCRLGSYRSEVYTLSVWTPPEVVSIGLLYRYPDYLEMEDRDVPYGGDITAPEGTEVVVSVTVNKALEKAVLVLGDGEEMALRNSDDAVWEGTLSIVENGTYEVGLRDVEGEENEYARAYKNYGEGRSAAAHSGPFSARG